jgi:N12 class adenine-specific DNA methylase
MRTSDSRTSTGSWQSASDVISGVVDQGLDRHVQGLAASHVLERGVRIVAHTSPRLRRSIGLYGVG